MAIFDLAVITEQGIDFVLVPLHASFEFRSEHEKCAMVARIRSATSRAGLSGVVIPVWALRSGKMGYLTPEPYRAMMRGFDLEFVAQNINGQIDVCDQTGAVLNA
jgi:hypothetical protein